MGKLLTTITVLLVSLNAAASSDFDYSNYDLAPMYNGPKLTGQALFDEPAPNQYCGTDFPLSVGNLLTSGASGVMSGPAGLVKSAVVALARAVVEPVREIEIRRHLQKSAFEKAAQICGPIYTYPESVIDNNTQVSALKYLACVNLMAAAEIETQFAKEKLGPISTVLKIEDDIKGIVLDKFNFDKFPFYLRSAQLFMRNSLVNTGLRVCLSSDKVIRKHLKLMESLEEKSDGNGHLVQVTDDGFSFRNIFLDGYVNMVVDNVLSTSSKVNKRLLRDGPRTDK